MRTAKSLLCCVFLLGFNISPTTAQTVLAWGDNSGGQCDVPASLSEVVAVAVGSRHSLALRADGSVVSWGVINTVPDSATNIVQIAAGPTHNIALRSDGTVVAWEQAVVRPAPAAVTNVIAVAAGAATNLALRADGTVVGWYTGPGSSVICSNVLGLAAVGKALLVLEDNGSSVLRTNNRNTRLFRSTADLVAVSAGDWQMLGLTARGTLVAVGGSLPLGVSNLVSIAAGTNYSLGLSADGVLMGWGPSPLTAFPTEMTNVIAMAAGPRHCLAVTAKNAGPRLLENWAYRRTVFSGAELPLCARVVGSTPMNYQWVVNGSLMPDSDFSVPQFPAGLSGTANCQVIVSNAFGAVTSAVVTVAIRSVAALGSDVYSQSRVPPDLNQPVSVAAGSFHSLGLNADGTVKAWGKNRYGQATLPQGLSDVRAIAAGGEHSLALRANGTLVAWGSTNNGQCGVPRNLANVAAISAGWGHSLALRADGTLAAWGSRQAGQSEIALFARDVIAIASGYWHNIALRADGTVMTSGLEYPIPAAASNVVAVAAGWESCLVLRADGTLIAWGDNSHGQCNIPAEATNVTAIAAGAAHYAALRADGSSVAWGREYLGTTILPTGGPAGLGGVACGVACGDDTTLVYAGSTSPFISPMVTNISVLEGGPLVISATLGGAGTISCQWRHNGTPIPSATNRFVLLTRAMASDAGAYSLIAANEFGQASSDTVRVGVRSSGGVAHGVMVWQHSGDGRPGIAADGAEPVCGFAVGGFHGLTLDTKGRVGAWGKNSDGQLDVPASATNIAAVAAGGDHSLALRADGSVRGWGRNWNGQASPPASATNIVMISAGWAHSLALRADGVVCAWGNNDYGQSSVPPAAMDICTISAGWYHSMALRADGQIFTWGLEAAVPSEAQDVISISAGREHCLALRADGTVVAWGDNTFGQCTVPADATNIVAISAGYFRDSASRADGTVVSWGFSQGSPSQPPSRSSGIMGLQSGEYFDGLLWAQGSPRFGRQLGTIVRNPSARTRLAPSLAGAGPMEFQWFKDGDPVVGATNRWLDLTGLKTAGVYSLHATNASGFELSPPTTVQVWEAAPAVTVVGGWGSDRSGQLSVPPNLTDVREISAGGFHALALKADGTVIAWGKNTDGQATVPGVLQHPLRFTHVAAGGNHSLGLTVGGWVEGWGRNWDHQTDFHYGFLYPATNIVAIAAGFAHSLALTTERKILAWGNNDLGQTNVPPLTSPVVAIAAGYYHNLALLANGSVVAWGLVTEVPSRVKDAVAISAGWWHSLALQRDGTVIAWGDNSYGQCRVPPEATNIISVAAGYFASFALKADGTVIAWGSRAYNLTNIPPGLTSISSLAAGEDYVLVVAETGPPRLVQPLVSRYDNVGATVSWAARACGAPPLSYQWYHGGQAIADATGRILTIPDAQPGDQGDYLLAVTNGAGSAASFTVRLTLSTAPEVVPESSLRYVPLGGVIHIAPQVYGVTPTDYTWSHDGMELNDDGRISGSHSAALNIHSATPADSGAYTLTVRNTYGTTRRQAAQIEVTCIMGWGDNSAGQITIPKNATDIVAISAGGDHSLALRANGSLLAWGDNQQGKNKLPPNATNIVAIHDGLENCFAARADGTVIAWGLGRYGLTNVPPDATNVLALASSLTEAYALRDDGSLVHWGLGQTPPDSQFAAIDAGRLYGLGLLPTGEAVTWNQPLAATPEGLTNIISIAAGYNHALALRQDGQVFAWGNNDFGQCTVPDGLRNVVEVAAGENTSFALFADGSAVSWGGDFFDPAAVPEWIKGARQLRAGADHCLALVGSNPQEFELETTVVLGNPLFLTGVRGPRGTTYQWSYNGLTIAGATNIAFRLSAALLSHGGTYHLTRTDALGGSSQQVFYVQVERPALEFEVASVGFQPTTQAFTFRVRGLIGSGPLIIQASDNLLDWNPILTNAPAVGTVELLDLNSTNHGYRFYRAYEGF
jgi:alpha-tubulin suppressor-like RCC1 family protein